MLLKKITKAAFGFSSLLISSQGAGCDNNIDNSGQFDEMVSIRQFRANPEIEDRICVTKMHKIKGVAVGVFDGHGGSLCADYLAGNFPIYLNERIRKNMGKGSILKVIEGSLAECFDDLQNGWKTIFQQNINEGSYQMTGSCGLVAILTPLLLVVANVGDSEGVLLGGKKIMKINRRLNAGESFEQERLLKEFPGETDIIKCLKKTNYCYVKGELQPTRAFGDFYLKDRQYNFASLEQFSKPYITHKPEINWYNLSPYLGKSLVLGSDGLWDQLNSEQINNIYLTIGNSAQFSELLLKSAISKILKRTKIPSVEKLEAIPNRRKLHDDISIVTVNILKFQNHYFPKFNPFSAMN